LEGSNPLQISSARKENGLAAILSQTCYRNQDFLGLWTIHCILQWHNTLRLFTQIIHTIQIHIAYIHTIQIHIAYTFVQTPFFATGKESQSKFLFLVVS
jgi:hypothetical protein